MADEQKTGRQAGTGTGAAKVAQEQANESEAQRAGAAAPDEGNVFAPGGRVIKAGEAVTLESADVDSDQFVVVKEDVYQEFYPENSRRPSYRLLFHKGQVVAKSQLESADEASRQAQNPNA